ncbi:MAG: insulinase family protein [Bacteroidetes bacterium]|nr:insulinase family protein [Bacteroidota bacterium]
MRLILALLMAPALLMAQPQFVVKPGASTKIVVKLQFRNGSIADPAGKEGLTALTAALVSGGGTESQTYSDIQDQIYPMAARYWSSTDKEVSVFTFEFHKDFSAEFQALIRDLMLKPRFDQADFDRIKKSHLTYVEKDVRASSDEDYSKLALEDFLFRGTNYQHMVMGTVPGVQSITPEDVKAHYQAVFTRNNLIVGVTGSYSESFLKQLESDLAGLPDGKPVLPEPGKARTPDGIQVEIITKPDAFGSAIFMGTPLSITRSSDEFAALMVANSWLGEHRKSYSRLYQKIRETRSMNYGDYSYIEWYESGGQYMLPPSGVPRQSNYFSIWIRPVATADNLRTNNPAEMGNVKVGHAHFAIRMALRELDLLVKNGMTEADFKATVEFLRGYTKLYTQTPEDRIGYLLDSQFYGRVDWIQELDQLLASVTLEQVNAAIKKHWQTQNLFVTIVTNDKEAGPLAAALKSNQPSPMIYKKAVAEKLPASVFEEDKQVAVFPLNVKSVSIVPSADTFKK